MKVVFAQRAEDPWRIVLEFEVVLGGRRQLVSDDVKREFMTRSKVVVGQWSLYLGLGPGELGEGNETGTSRKVKILTPMRMPVNILYMST